MSNRAFLIRTKFQGDDDETDWGWRMGDDYFHSYSDNFTEQDVPTAPLEFLAKAVEGAIEDDFFESLLDNNRGIFINGSWHDFEEIAPVLRRALFGED